MMPNTSKGMGILEVEPLNFAPLTISQPGAGRHLAFGRLLHLQQTKVMGYVVSLYLLRPRTRWLLSVGSAYRKPRGEGSCQVFMREDAAGSLAAFGIFGRTKQFGEPTQISDLDGC